MSALAGITASGKAMPPGLIAKRKSMHPDLDTVPIRRRIPIHYTEKGFVTGRVFGDCLRGVVIPYFKKAREKLRRDDLVPFLI